MGPARPSASPGDPGALPRRAPASRVQWLALAQRAEAETHRLIARVLAQPRLAGVPRAPQNPALPSIRFDLRGQAAGQFRLDRAGRCEIRYNLALLARHGEDFLRRTVPHETAHYLVWLIHGRGIRPHGPEWQQLMRSLGADPSRCHAYDVSGLQARALATYDYHCGCADHRLTSIRHARMLRGTRYHCRKCGEPLRPGTRD